MNMKHSLHPLPPGTKHDDAQGTSSEAAPQRFPIAKRKHGVWYSVASILNIWWFPTGFSYHVEHKHHCVYFVRLEVWDVHFYSRPKTEKSSHLHPDVIAERMVCFGKSDSKFEILKVGSTYPDMPMTRQWDANRLTPSPRQGIKSQHPQITTKPRPNLLLQALS